MKAKGEPIVQNLNFRQVFLEFEWYIFSEPKWTLLSRGLCSINQFRSFHYNIKFQKSIPRSGSFTINDFAKDFITMNSFLEWRTEIDLFGIAHVKVEFITVQKIYTIRILGRFVRSTHFVHEEHFFISFVLV